VFVLNFKDKSRKKLITSKLEIIQNLSFKIKMSFVGKLGGISVENFGATKIFKII